MRWLIGLAALFASPSAAALAAAAPSVDAPPTDAPPAFMNHKGLSDEDLDMLRGGFELQGVSISLGAQLNTYLNGQLVLATTLNWTTGGPNTTSSIALTPASEATLQSVVSSGGTFGMTSSGGQSYITNNGQTLIYQNAANGLQNVLVNTASGVNATQTINATVGIAGYAGYNSANLAASLGRTLGAAVGIAGIH